MRIHELDDCGSTVALQTYSLYDVVASGDAAGVHYILASMSTIVGETTANGTDSWAVP